MLGRKPSSEGVLGVFFWRVLLHSRGYPRGGPSYWRASKFRLCSKVSRSRYGAVAIKLPALEILRQCAKVYVSQLANATFAYLRTRERVCFLDRALYGQFSKLEPVCGSFL